MKKITSFIAMLGVFIVPIIGAYASMVLQKNVITKEYILARSELKKNVDNAEQHIDELHSFFANISDDTDELEDILERIKDSASLTHSPETKIILNYMEKLCLYTLVGNNDTYTPKENNKGEGNNGENNNEENNNEGSNNENIGNHQWKDANLGTLSETETLKNIILAHAKNHSSLTYSIGNVIQKSTSNGSYFTLGYPNYGNLGMMKGGYQDSLDREYIISVLESDEGDYFQILGYLRKDEDTKVAYIVGNYSKPNEYFPESLFVDPVTGNPILSGDEFNIQ